MRKLIQIPSTQTHTRTVTFGREFVWAKKTHPTTVTGP